MEGAEYQQDLSPGFMAMADVYLVVADKTFHAHSQFLAAESRVLEAALEDLELQPSAKQPWVIESLQSYSSPVMERFLSAVYRPTPLHDVQEAWELIDIADQLDCTRMLTALQSILENQTGILSKTA